MQSFTSGNATPIPVPAPTSSIPVPGSQLGRDRHKACIAREIATTFTTSYTAEVGLAQAVTVAALNVYGKQETGKKYLLNPQKTAVAKL